MAKQKKAIIWMCCRSLVKLLPLWEVRRILSNYFGVSERIVWNTVQDDLPGLVEPLKRLLSSEGD